jgi:4a-hydroxytetrahydrobiopterin dehydratase
VDVAPYEALACCSFSAFFRSQTFAVSIAFVDAIARLAPEGREPDIDIRVDGVTVLLRAFKPEGYGMTVVELELARRISSAAAELGLVADPAGVQSLSMIPGAPDRRDIMPFWQAVLAYEPRPDNPDEDIVDPHARLAPFWFENMDALRSDGMGSVHFVIWVPWDQAQARIDAGLAAGGRIVRENTEELFWTLADPVGNEVDIATTPAPEGA